MFAVYDLFEAVCKTQCSKSFSVAAPPRAVGALQNFVFFWIPSYLAVSVEISRQIFFVRCTLDDSFAALVGAPFFTLILGSRASLSLDMIKSKHYLSG